MLNATAALPFSRNKKKKICIADIIIVNFEMFKTFYFVEYMENTMQSVLIYVFFVVKYLLICLELHPMI